VSADFPFKQWLVSSQSPKVEALMKQAAERDDVISFAGGLPADDLFPTQAMRATLEQVMAEHGREALQYHWAEGYEPLRTQILAMMRARGVEARDSELLITNGAQQALDLLARLLLRTGDPLGIESPTYGAAIEVLRLQRPRMCAVQRSADGLDMDGLRRVLTDDRPNLVYLCPAGHNPTGGALDGAARRELVELAARHDSIFIDDDAYGRIQYEGAHPPLRSEAGSEQRVIHIGSFSKVLTPGLRVGWLIAPRVLIDQLLLLKAAADLQTGSLSQIVLSTYLEHHDLDAHLERCLEHYRARRDATLAALERELSGALRWWRPRSGFSLWAALPDGRPAEQLLRSAIDHGVAFELGAPCFPCAPAERPQQFLRLCFSNLSPQQIDDGVRRLAAALHDG
jgi:DNA-binding transcriptional MocR family regulator